MNILYASDNCFAPILSVSIASLVSHVTDSCITIYVIDDNISENNKRILSYLVTSSNYIIKFLKKDTKKELNNVRLSIDRGSQSQFSRLFIQEILPSDCDKVLYLDCDTLIVDDLNELYNTDLKNNVVGGVLDSFSKWHYKALGLEIEDIYINSGVMLIDINRWKEEKIEKKLIQEIIKHKGRLLQGDQGLLNSVLKGRIEMLQLRYDLMCYNYDFSYKGMELYRKPYKYYNEQEIKEAKNNPAIIHFTSSFASMRPWQCDRNDHPYSSVWREYYENNGYKIEILSIKNTSKVYKELPSTLVLVLLGLVHAYLKPIIWIIRHR